MDSLTQRQRSILAFVDRYHAERGFSPSYRDIGRHVGLRSASAVTHQLRQLELAGWVRLNARTPRAIVVLRKPGEAA